VTVRDVDGATQPFILIREPTLGIWDCMSSQDVVDFIRRKVWEGKELAEIGEMMCDHCLAPDTFGAGIGCDNMTVLIVALLQGRTKEEWYAWIHDRVQKGYGFETPMNPPQIYSQSRLMSFRLQREAREEREYGRDDADGFSAFFGSSGMFGGVGHVLGNGGGVSFHPGSSIMTNNGPLTFGSDDSDDSDDGEGAEDELMFESDNGRSLFGHPLDFERDSADATSNLRDRLAEFELEIGGASHIEEVDDDHPEPDTITPDSPPSPPQKVNGDASIPAAAQSEGEREGSSVPSNNV
jgi:protein phosphatase PTC2/3